MSRPFHYTVFICSLLSASCAGSKERVTASFVHVPEKNIIRLRRSNPADSAVLTGKIDLLAPDGRFYPQTLAVISVNQKISLSNPTGNYKRTVAPGKLRLRAGFVGILWSVVPPFSVAQGDSLIIDFHLRPDPRPLTHSLP